MKLAYCLLIASLPLAVVAQQPSRIEGPLTIDQAVAIAQKNSPAIAGALADALGSNGAARAARARMGPQLSLNGFASAGNDPSIVATPPSSDPAAFMGLPSDGFADANLALMFPLYTGGALGAALSAAQWADRGAQGSVLEARCEVSLNVTEAYLAYLRYSAMASDVAQRLVAQQETTRIAQANYEAGKEIKSSVGRAEAEESLVRRQMESASNDVAKALIELIAAMGVDFNSKPLPIEELDRKVVPLTLDDYLQESKKRRGLLLAAESKVRSAQADVRSAEGAFRPQIYGFAMGDASTGSPSGGTVFGVTVSLPVFDSGLRRAEVGRFRAMRARADADLQAIRINVERDIRQAWFDVQTAEKNLALAQTAVEPMLASYRAVSIRYANGKATMIEQLEALETVTRARTELAQAQYDRRLAIARLERSAGMLPHAESTPQEKNP